jgi:hypothetical protein
MKKYDPDSTGKVAYNQIKNILFEIALIMNYKTPSEEMIKEYQD